MLAIIYTITWALVFALAILVRRLRIFVARVAGIHRAWLSERLHRGGIQPSAKYSSRRAVAITG